MKAAPPTRFPTVLLAAWLCAWGLGAAHAAEFGAFDLASDPTYAHAAAVARAYAFAHSKAPRSRLCVVGLARGAERSAWIVWRDKDQAILWEGQDLQTTPSRRALDLKRDVVASEAELHGSTYLVTRAWVRSLIETCRRRGLQVDARRTR